MGQSRRGPEFLKSESNRGDKSFVGFKFTIKNSSSGNDEKGGGGVPPAPRTPLSQANPDWSERTSSMWQEHTNFLERTRVTGIHPPVRGGTITGLIAAEKKRSETSRRFARVGMMLVIPLTAGGVFFFLNTEEPLFKTEEASVEAVTIKPVAKNPNKGKAVPAGQDAAAQKPKDLLAVEADLVLVKESPYSLGAADSNYKIPNEKLLKPIVELSKSPPADGDLPPIIRQSPALDYTRDETNLLSKWIAKDPGARAIAEQWKKEARARVGVGVNPVPQFRFDTAQARRASEIGRQDLRDMRPMTMAAYAFGEQDVAEQLHQSILGWVSAYKPLGDVYSDAELAPLVRAYGSVWRRFTPAELKATDDWLLKIADRQVTEAIQRPNRNDRWFAYHLHMVTLIGYVTGNGQLQNYVKKNFPVHLATALRPDGSTTTLEQTGSMTLHVEHLSRLLDASVVLYRIGRIDPETVPHPANAFGRAVAFTAPYVIGQKTWTDFEKPADPVIAKRQAAGDVSVASKPYIWRMDTSYLEALSFFRLAPNVVQIAQAVGTPEARFPMPEILFYDSMIRDVAWLSPAPIPPPGPRPASVPPDLPAKAK